jgi:hypothetical protein
MNNQAVTDESGTALQSSGSPTTEEKRVPPGEVTTLTIDLGTHTGWALMAGQIILESGTELLASEKELQQQRTEGKERTNDLRFGRFLGFLERKAAARVDRFVFEDVRFVRGPDQTQLWASLRAAIWFIATRLGLVVSCVSVPTLKVFATGIRGATKRQMAQALAKASPMQYVVDPENGTLQRAGISLDDNEVDALWLARYTAAVDRGEEDFLSVYARKAAARTEKRAKRIATRAKKKARDKARKLEARTKHLALIASIKAAGKCCGVFRKAAPYGRAICPKCGQAIRIPKAPGPPSDRNPNPDFALKPAVPVESR